MGSSLGGKDPSTPIISNLPFAVLLRYWVQKTDLLA